jgi:hypothetical protein
LSTSVSVSVPVATGVPGVVPAGLDHRAGGGAGNHGRVIGAADGDGDQLVVPSTVATVKVSVSVPDIERLHCRVGIVEG